MGSVKKTAYYPGPFGLFRIVEEDAAIIAIDLVMEDVAEAGGERTDLTDQAARELAEYLAGQRKVFTVPLQGHAVPPARLAGTREGAIWSYDNV